MSFNFAKYKSEEFHIEYELLLDGGSITASIKNEKLSAPESSSGGASKNRAGKDLEAQDRIVDVASMKPGYEPYVALKIQIDPKTRYLFKADKNSASVEGQDELIEFELDVKERLFNGSFLISILLSLPVAPYEALRSLLVRAWSFKDARRFDESLGFLRYIVGKSHYVTVLGPRGLRESSSIQGNGPLPFSVAGAVMQESKQWQEPKAVAGISISGERVELLKKMASMLGFESVQLQMTHLGTDVAARIEEIRFGNFRFMLQRHDGSVISHDLLSYGQKRVLAFLYYLEGSPDVVIADELVDGLHHSWIEDCIEAIGDRQVFLASQNPLLLDYLEFDSAEKVGKSFIQCRNKAHKSGDRMSWSNLSEVDAERFFDAYQVGLQHVSEILRSKGLW